MAFDLDDAMVGTEESTDEESRLEDVLTRTESQQAKQVKVQKVVQRMQGHRKSVQHLKSVMESLASVSPPSKLAGEALKEVEQHQREARNVGEDLLEDILALDSLSNLFAEDRLSRKAALGEIEALTDEVNGVKSALLKHRCELSALHDEQQKQEKQREAARMEEQACPCEEDEEDEKKDTGNEESRFPSAEAWAKLKVPLRFQYQNLAESYIGVAKLPGIAAEDIKLELGDDGSTLRIAGLRLPNSNESEALHQHLLNRLGRPPAAPEEYLQAGRGRFGYVSETVRLPRDVDVCGIEASCRGGVLQLTLPRQRQRLRQPSGFTHSSRAPMDTFGPFHGMGLTRQPSFASGW